MLAQGTDEHPRPSGHSVDPKDKHHKIPARFQGCVRTAAQAVRSAVHFHVCPAEFASWRSCGLQGSATTSAASLRPSAQSRHAVYISHQLHNDGVTYRRLPLYRVLALNMALPCLPMAGVAPRLHHISRPQRNMGLLCCAAANSNSMAAVPGHRTHRAAARPWRPGERRLDHDPSKGGCEVNEEKLRTQHTAQPMPCLCVVAYLRRVVSKSLCALLSSQLAYNALSCDGDNAAMCEGNKL